VKLSKKEKVFTARKKLPTIRGLKTTEKLILGKEDNIVEI